MIRLARSAIVCAVACSSAPPHREPPPRDPPIAAQLPKPTPVDTDEFAGVIVCDRCHSAGDTAMRDRAGRDVSPNGEMAANMMGLAARDPYYLAAVARELAAAPRSRAAIEELCLRCHAPVGVAASRDRQPLTLAAITETTSDIASLAREGVGCLGCHALEPDGLGDARTLTRPTLRRDRTAFGALPQPLEEAMVTMAKTRPLPARHISESRLCASCHTVIVRALDDQGTANGPEIAEQTTYLEWRNSDFQNEHDPAGPRAMTCQGCHMPRSADELGAGPPIASAYSTRPPDAPVRDSYRRHALRGGNAYLLERLAANAEWLNAKVTSQSLADAAIATRAFLRRSARLAIAPAGDDRTLRVTVINDTGHKLPTGYPSRRMWLYIVARDRDGVAFESGRFDAATGALLDQVNQRIDRPGDPIIGHRDRIDSPDQVVVWEAVPVDSSGHRTHLLLGTAAIAKDNRILPAGWRRDRPDGELTRAIGVDGDDNFVAGSDSVTIRLPRRADQVSVSLMYQAIPPETIESYPPGDGPLAARFRSITREPPRPERLAEALWQAAQ